MVQCRIWELLPSHLKEIFALIIIKTPRNSQFKQAMLELAVLSITPLGFINFIYPS